jgi:hypothetical protein
VGVKTVKLYDKDFKKPSKSRETVPLKHTVENNISEQLDVSCASNMCAEDPIN